MKINPSQKTFLFAVAGGFAAVIAYFKFVKKPAVTVPASGGTATNFTGGYDTYPAYMGADGRQSQPPVRNRCKEYMEVLEAARHALANSASLTADQIAAFQSQEREALANMQRHGCHLNSGKGQGNGKGH